MIDRKTSARWGLLLVLSAPLWAGCRNSEGGAAGNAQEANPAAAGMSWVGTPRKFTFSGRLFDALVERCLSKKAGRDRTFCECQADGLQHAVTEAEFAAMNAGLDEVSAGLTQRILGNEAARAVVAECAVKLETGPAPDLTKPSLAPVRFGAPAVDVGVALPDASEKLAGGVADIEGRVKRVAQRSLSRIPVELSDGTQRTLSITVDDLALEAGRFPEAANVLRLSTGGQVFGYMIDEEGAMEAWRTLYDSACDGRFVPGTLETPDGALELEPPVCAALRGLGLSG